MSTPTTVVIADDQALVRNGFAALLQAEPDIEVIGCAADGVEALALVTEVAPDVVLMDIRMPELDGIEATRRIRANPALAGVRVLVLTTFDTDDNVLAALKAGAAGFLLKGMEPAALVHAVHLVRESEALVAPAAIRTLVGAHAGGGPGAHLTAELERSVTARELEVLRLVAEGLSNNEIAERLVISPVTVKTHLSSLLSKHQLSTRVQLVVLAYESGLVVPGQ